MSLDSLCSTHSVLIEKPVITQDASGGSVRTWQTFASAVLCNIQPLTFKEKVAYGQRQIFYTNKIYFSQDPQVTRDFRLSQTWPVLTPSRQFVALAEADMAGQGRAWVLEVREQVNP